MGAVVVWRSPTAALVRGCRVNLQKWTARRVVGGISQISAQMRLLSHQAGVRAATGMVLSHDLLMHLYLDRFVRQPRS
jgi:hypothetical protein